MGMLFAVVAFAVLFVFSTSKISNANGAEEEIKRATACLERNEMSSNILILDCGPLYIDILFGDDSLRSSFYGVMRHDCAETCCADDPFCTEYIHVPGDNESDHYRDLMDNCTGKNKCSLDMQSVPCVADDDLGTDLEVVYYTCISTSTTPPVTSPEVTTSSPQWNITSSTQRPEEDESGGTETMVIILASIGAIAGVIIMGAGIAATIYFFTASAAAVGGTGAAGATGATAAVAAGTAAAAAGSAAAGGFGVGAIAVAAAVASESDQYKLEDEEPGGGGGGFLGGGTSVVMGTKYFPSTSSSANLLREEEKDSMGGFIAQTSTDTYSCSSSGIYEEIQLDVDANNAEEGIVSIYAQVPLGEGPDQSHQESTINSGSCVTASGSDDGYMLPFPMRNGLLNPEMANGGFSSGYTIQETVQNGSPPSIHQPTGGYPLPLQRAPVSLPPMVAGDKKVDFTRMTQDSRKWRRISSIMGHWT